MIHSSCIVQFLLAINSRKEDLLGRYCSGGNIINCAQESISQQRLDTKGLQITDFSRLCLDKRRQKKEKCLQTFLCRVLWIQGLHTFIYKPTCLPTVTKILSPNWKKFASIDANRLVEYLFDELISIVDVHSCIMHREAQYGIFLYCTKLPVHV